MKTLSYSDFSGRLHASVSGRRIPLHATLETTYRCNNRCVHCYCGLPASDRAATEEELSTGEIKALFDVLASMGSFWLLITGGEPLLRDDFEEIYLHAKKRGFLITLFTNGTLLGEDRLRLLSRSRPFVVEITLYGATEETYERVSGVRGSFIRCMNGIERIVGEGIKLKLKSMALTLNSHEMEAMDDLARGLGCEFRFDPVIHRRIDENLYSEPENFRIPPEEVARLDRMFPKRIEAFRGFCEKFIGPPRQSDRLYRCGAGRTSLHINPYGLASGCSMMVKNGFSARRLGLRRVWEEAIPSVIDQKKEFALPCDDCHLMNLCGQCPPWSIIENGDARKEVAYLCEIAKMREKNFSFLKDAQGGKEYGGGEEEERVVKA